MKEVEDLEQRFVNSTTCDALIWGCEQPTQLVVIDNLIKAFPQKVKDSKTSEEKTTLTIALKKAQAIKDLMVSRALPPAQFRERRGGGGSKEALPPPREAERQIRQCSIKETGARATGGRGRRDDDSVDDDEDDGARARTTTTDDG